MLCVSGGMESLASLVITAPLSMKLGGLNQESHLDLLGWELDSRMNGENSNVGFFKVGKFGETIDKGLARLVRRESRTSPDGSNTTRVDDGHFTIFTDELVGMSLSKESSSREVRSGRIDFLSTDPICGLRVANWNTRLEVTSVVDQDYRV